MSSLCLHQTSCIYVLVHRKTLTLRLVQVLHMSRWLWLKLEKQKLISQLSFFTCKVTFELDAFCGTSWLWRINPCLAKLCYQSINLTHFSLFLHVYLYQSRVLQQHGSVFWKQGARATLRGLDASHSMYDQLQVHWGKLATVTVKSVYKELTGTIKICSS